MPTALPIILLAGAAFLAVSSKKRAAKSSKPADAKGTFKYKSVEKKSIPETYKKALPAPKDLASTTSWEDRQDALLALSTVVFYDENGGEVKLCNCDPGDVDGIPGVKTIAAIKAFQLLVGLEADGGWGVQEDLAMSKILKAVNEGKPIPCDPLNQPPLPFACFYYDKDTYGIMLTYASKPAPSPAPGPTPSPSPDTGIITADAECNYIVSQSDEWWKIQKRRIVEMALKDLFDAEAANEIHESMMADYLPFCLTLGYDGVGPGVKEFWKVNRAFIAKELWSYENFPETLEEDAEELGVG